MKIDIIKTPKGEIEYSITGKGKPILFLHGGHSNCRENLFHKGFDPEKYQLITPSRPGYGNTPLNNHFTAANAADLMISLVDSLGINQVILYAISAAGLTSIELAARYPERIEKIILASAVTKKWLDKNDQIYKTARILFNPKTEKIVWRTVNFFSSAFPQLIAKSFYTQFSKNKYHRLKKNDVNELLVTFKNYNSKSGFINDIDQDVDNELISKIQSPTLIVHSKNDNSVPFEHAEHAHNKIKNSILLGLDNEWGHLFWIGNDSEDTIKRTIEFIEQ